MEREMIEELIFGVVDIIYENRKLRRELEEAREYERKYNELLDEAVKNAADSQKALFGAIMSGVFSHGDQQ